MRDEYPNLELMEYIFKQTLASDEEWKKKFEEIKKERKYAFLDIYEVDRETICQYTGLTDKNGNRIWENDIVTFPDCEMTESGFGYLFVNAGKVAYDTESMSYFFTNRVTVDMGDIIIKNEVEVIGNVFDNSELLEN